jgi:hypothetical protein
VGLGLAFWILMLLSLIFGLAVAWPRQAPYYLLGGSLIWWLLLLLLGWSVFGPPLRA